MVQLKQNIAGYYDEQGRFRPIRSPQYVGSGGSRRKATKSDKRKYSKAKGGDLGKARQERALEAPWDREYRLDQEAKAAQEKERQRIEREIAGEIYGDAGGRMSTGKARTLAQFVRGMGGINTTARVRRGRVKYGDLENFTFKGSGQRGLVTTTPGKGKSLDYMHQAAREAGFDVVDMDDLLDRLDDEIRGGSPTYSTHGSLTYNPAESWIASDAELRLLNAETRRLASRPAGRLKLNPVGWFSDCKTGDEVKKLYRKLASKWHPDKAGGDLRKMQEINADYDKAMKAVANNETNEFRASAERAAAKPLREAIEFAVTLPDDVEVVIRGLWLWIQGNTFPIKDQLKAFRSSDGNRFKFASKKKAWFFAAVPSANRRGELSFDDIDRLHGRELVNDRKRRLKLNPGGDLDVANTILQQLGGSKFLAMTGAKNLGHTTKSLQFRLPANFASGGINYVKITLNGRDLYDVGFGKLRGLKYTIVKIDKNIYADMLRDLFTQRTGLDTSLGTMGRHNPASNPIKVLKHKFYVGQKLATRFIGDYDLILRGVVVSRTPKFVTVKIENDREPKRCGVSVWDDTEIIFPEGRYSMAPVFRAKDGDRVGNPTASGVRLVNNPDPLSTFANLAVGIASTLQVNEMLAKSKTQKAAKRRGTTTAKTNKRTNPAPAAKRSKGPKGDLYVLTIGSGDDLISVYLHDGDKDGFSKRFKTMAAAKSYATKNKVKLVSNPAAAKVNGIVSRAWARSRAKAEYARELRLAAAAERSRKRRSKYEGQARSNPALTADQKIFIAALEDPRLEHTVDSWGSEKIDRIAAQLRNKKLLTSWGTLTSKGYEIAAELRKQPSKTNPRSAAGKTAVARSTKANPRVIQLPVGFHWKKRQAAGGGDYFEITDPKGLIVGWGTTRTNALRTFKTYGVKAKAQSGFSKDRAKQIREGARSIRLPARKNPKDDGGKRFMVRWHDFGTGIVTETFPNVTQARTFARSIARKGHLVDVIDTLYGSNKGTYGPAKAKKRNPKASLPKRRTFEMFQGRPATTAKAMPVSRHAPARLDQLGDLIEIKLNSGKVLDLSGKDLKLCAAAGKLWIAGGKFAKANPAAKANEINLIDAIDHVVYGTYKPHHGDHKYTHYIHRLGEESGLMPTLCVDREGFPVIRGGNYKIEARGIVD